jgi:hypothetical protein
MRDLKGGSLACLQHAQPNLLPRAKPKLCGQVERFAVEQQHIALCTHFHNASNHLVQAEAQLLAHCILQRNEPTF